jgi:class 3 adenylate cyclase
MAEYKQVTVLFADVVRSMDIAATLGAERLREIMTELVNRSATVVQRYGGTVDKFTGDGIMASSARQLHRRITPTALAWRRWTSSRKQATWPRRSNTATVSISAADWPQLRPGHRR